MQLTLDFDVPAPRALGVIASLRAQAAALSARGVQWDRVPLTGRKWSPWRVLCNRGACYAQTGWEISAPGADGRCATAWHGPVAMHAKDYQ